jgi:hypothetical protein
MRANAIGAALVGLFAALAVTQHASALSCSFSKHRYYFDCESGVCSPLFRAGVHFTFEPCGARWVVKSITGDDAALLLGELARRGTQTGGVLEVSIHEYRLRTLEIAEWADQRDQVLGEAEVKAVQGSPHEIREEWEAKESDGFWKAFRGWLPAWLWAAALLVVLFAAARRVQQHGLARRNSRSGVVVFSIAIQLLLGFVGYVAVLYGRDNYGAFTAPIALLAPAAIGAVAIELVMLAAKRLRARI